MSIRPPAPQHIEFAGAAGPLEAMFEDPRSEAVGATRAAVVCHPHPLFGGTMHNKVVHTVARALSELGLPTLRFNFRGVGASAGVHDHGIGETDDALLALDELQRRVPGAEPVLAGFSFGAYVALRAAQRRPLAALITVAPPVGRWDFGGIAAPACPWLVIQGEQDDVVSPQAVYDWVLVQSPAPRIARVADAGHFFHGKLAELRDAVRRFMSDRVNLSGTGAFDG